MDIPESDSADETVAWIINMFESGLITQHEVVNLLLRVAAKYPIGDFIGNLDVRSVTRLREEYSSDPPKSSADINVIEPICASQEVEAQHGTYLDTKAARYLRRWKKLTDYFSGRIGR